MSQRVEWEVLKSSGRWRGTRAEALEPGARLDGDGLGDLFRARGDDLLLRILPGTPAVWRRRAETLVKLGHPRLLGIVGIGHLDDRVVLVEDLHQHPDLHTFVRAAGAAGGLSLREVGRVFTEVLSALRHIHGANLTHGGLSAGRVSVGRDGVGVLEARVSGAGVLSGLREDGEAVPLELWDTLAPELVEASARATVASDLFAVGVLLMHALTGDLHPPGTRSPWRELSTNTEALRRAIRAAREDLPDALVELIAGLLAAQPKERQPKSVQELLRHIQKERWEPREIPVRPSKPSQPLPSPALVAAPQERPLMIVTSRPVPRAADAPAPRTLAADDAGAEAVSRVVPPSSSLPEETVETKLPPAVPSEELADDTLPVVAPGFRDRPQAISPAPVEAASVAVVPADAAPVEPSPVEASPVEPVPPSTRASDKDELVSTLPLLASATRTLMPDDPEATVPIGASSSAFTTDVSREGEVTSQSSGPSSAGRAPRAIPPTQRLSLPEPSASLGTDLFADAPPPMVYDDVEVATSVKVHRAAPPPSLVQPQVATAVSAPAVGRRSGYDPPTPTVALPGLTSHERSMVRPSDKNHPVADSEGLPLPTKVSILLTSPALEDELGTRPEGMPPTLVLVERTATYARPGAGLPSNIAELVNRRRNAPTPSTPRAPPADATPARAGSTTTGIGEVAARVNGWHQTAAELDAISSTILIPGSGAQQGPEGDTWANADPVATQPLSSGAGDEGGDTLDLSDGLLQRDAGATPAFRPVQPGPMEETKPPVLPGHLWSPPTQPSILAPVSYPAGRRPEPELFLKTHDARTELLVAVALAAAAAVVIALALLAFYLLHTG